MKWFNLLLVTVLMLSFNACQRHDKSELNVIRMENEPPVGTANSKKASESMQENDTKPAPKYF